MKSKYGKDRQEPRKKSKEVLESSLQGINILLFHRIQADP